MKTIHLTTNFTAGELSPRLLGRVDIARYPNAAELLENVLVVVEGGARRRDGTLYVASAKFPAKRVRLIPFVYGAADAYVLEFGDQYIRFYKNGAQLKVTGVPYEVVSPLTESMLFEFDYAQGADTMFITHGSLLPLRLRRFGDTNWVLDTVPFEPIPFDEIGHSFPGVTLTLSAATVGAARTATASGGAFLNGDVGRHIYFRGGALKITGFTSATVVTGDISSAFESVAIAAGVWTLADSPQDAITPSAKDPLEASITLTSATLDVWRTSDVGKFVDINGGLVLLTGYTSAKVVTGTIKNVLAAVVAAPIDAWILQAAVWSSGNGYPQACTLYQQRFIVGGTLAFPQTIWGSSIGSYIDFTLGPFDSDAFSYTLSSGQINPIVHLAAGKLLHALTFGSEFAVKGGVEKPITPTNIQVEVQSSYGARKVRPIQAAKDIMFVQRSGLKIRSLTYDAAEDDYDAENVTALAQHITASKIVDLTYKQEPDPYVLAARTDGLVSACCFDRKQEVIAWSRLVTDGVVESLASIPTEAGDQTWVLARRNINGVTARYIERFDANAKLDAAVIASGPASATWGGLGHLEGESVDCLADGAYKGRFTVTGGSITLDRKALAVQIGLPYAWLIRLLTPETGSGEGSAQGQAMSTSEVTVRFLASYACDMNGDEIAFREFGSELLDEAPVPFTGVKRIETLGWERGESVIELSNGLPFDVHVLGVVRTLTVNAG